MKLSHKAMIIISGLVWFAVGCALLPLGLKLLLNSIAGSMLGDTHLYPLMNWLTGFVGNPQYAAVVLIALGLFIGQLKGKKVLSKSARRNIARIQTFSNPTSVTNLYGKGYLVIFAVMVGLGMSIRYFGVPTDIRGFIDVTIGTALIQGSVTFFREAQALPKAAQDL